MKRIGVNFFGLEVTVGRHESAAPRNRIECGYNDWDDAVAHATGYDESSILSKAIAAAREVRDGRAAFERDTVVFKDKEFDHPLLAWLLYAVRKTGQVRVMDFGGALASLYYQHRGILEQLPGFAWGVVEQAHFVEAGQREFETGNLRFFKDIKSCAESIQPNFMLISSVLQYLPNPYDLLAQVLGLQLPFVLIHRTPAQTKFPEQAAVQHVPSTIYRASYPVWLLDARRLESVFSSHGYDILDNFDPHPGTLFGPDGAQSPYQSWLLVRKEQNK